ncbi:MAG TPA: hypothetical protein VH650_04870 [Gaiellaceae bacterium]|jgi:hypothetical protein
MEPNFPQMAREEGISGTGLLAAISLVVCSALVLALVVLASDERAAEKVAKRLHLASAAEVAKARNDATRAAREAEAATSYSEHEIALIEEELGLLMEQTSDAALEAAQLRSRLDGLTDVAALDDLVSQVNALHARVTSLEARLGPAR